MEVESDAVRADLKARVADKIDELRAEVKKEISSIKAQNERLVEALAAAAGELRSCHVISMCGAAIDEEIERSWQHYLKTSPVMRQIVAALENHKGGPDGQKG
jgi:FKBP-type peptidyl-prolyl cis-trans isomerase (trigger factor)